MKRLKNFLIAGAAFVTLLLASGATFAQGIQIEVASDGTPVIRNKLCPNGGKGDVCPPKGTKAPVTFTVTSAGNNWRVDRIELIGVGPNAGSDASNPACYTAAVNGCGGLVPHTYCPGTGTATAPYQVGVDFPEARNNGSACTISCSGPQCQMRNENTSNWMWRYRVFVTNGTTTREADPIITNRGTGRN